MEPGGLPLAFLMDVGDVADPTPPPEEGSAAALGGDEKPPADWGTVTEDGAVDGERANAMVPSGPYFLGLPLFLFMGSVPGDTITSGATVAGMGL